MIFMAPISKNHFIIYLYSMKYGYFIGIILLLSQLSFGQVPPPTKDSVSRAGGSNIFFSTVDQVPQFPGGLEGFSKYLSKNIKYPDIARLIGINGNVIVSFVVGSDGKVVEARPIRCIGAGCDAEAVKVIEMSPDWTPGFQKGKPVRCQYTVPINFNIETGKVRLNELRNSGYGFVFNLKGTLYTIDEAQAIIGRSFMSDDIEIAEPFFNYNKIAKFDMPDKKEVYLLIFKSKQGD